MTTYSALELEGKLGRCPRQSLAFLPTPLHHCPRFSQALGGPSIWMKRDDQTGLAFGGNKTRILEYLMGQVVEQGADCIVTGAATTSNFCRQTTAAARKLGLPIHLVMAHGIKGPEEQGNLLLDKLMGACIEIVAGDIGKDYFALLRAVEEKSEALRAEGRRPFLLDLVVKEAPLGAIAYVDGYLELRQQLEENGLQADHVVLAAGGATQSGLALAAKALGDSIEVAGFTPYRWDEPRQVDIARIANRAADELGIDVHLDPEEIINSDEQVGESYGLLTPGCVEALKLVASTEGIFLDPVYTSKAMAGLIDWIRSGKIPPDATVVFLHTGGTPALFSYAQDILGV
jgi:1-aminocyclopropane-1-carboxylate deaminase/D-cysteine desulfhydrase-like pyridoxal-dependent ACC family enzyme